jgi:hypothetical protein
MFAYPYGSAHPVIEARAASLFDACFSARPAICRESDPLYDLPRVDAFDLRTMRRLKLFLEGKLESRLWPRWQARLIRQQGLSAAARRLAAHFVGRRAVKVGSRELDPHKIASARCLAPCAASAKSRY